MWKGPCTHDTIGRLSRLEGGWLTDWLTDAEAPLQHWRAVATHLQCTSWPNIWKADYSRTNNRSHTTGSNYKVTWYSEKKEHRYSHHVPQPGIAHIKSQFPKWTQRVHLTVGFYCSLFNYHSREINALTLLTTRTLKALRLQLSISVSEAIFLLHVLLIPSKCNTDFQY